MTRPAAVAAGMMSRGARAGLILKAGSRVGYPQPLRPGPLARLPFGWSNFSESGVEGAMPDGRLLAVVVSQSLPQRLLLRLVRFLTRTLARGVAG